MGFRLRQKPVPPNGLCLSKIKSDHMGGKIVVCTLAGAALRTAAVAMVRPACDTDGPIQKHDENRCAASTWKSLRARTSIWLGRVCDQHAGTGAGRDCATRGDAVSANMCPVAVGFARRLYTKCEKRTRCAVLTRRRCGDLRRSANVPSRPDHRITNLRQAPGLRPTNRLNTREVTSV